MKQQKVFFHYLYTSFSLPDRTILKQFIENIFKKEGVKFTSVTYIFCSDEYLLSINQQYLQHNTLTDIITFDLSQSGEELTGEIYISIERVKENALHFHTSFNNELHRVIFHGILHLCGYKDKIKVDMELMRQKEDFYLQQYFVPRETL